MAEWIQGEVVQVKYWNESLFSLIIHAPIAPFTAGQFTKLGLQIGDEIVQRAYSFVNPPTNPNLEFYLVEVTQGKLSRQLHSLQAGDEILITEQSYGYFVLDEIPDCQTLWMLATGTGLAPYLAILQHGQDLERFTNIVLIHATRYWQEQSYQTLRQTLQQQYQGKLRIQSVVSREIMPQALTGRIPALLESGELEKCIGLSISAETSHVMLCGNPDMVRDTTEWLKYKRHMQKHRRRKPGHITTELYW